MKVKDMTNQMLIVEMFKQLDENGQCCLTEYVRRSKEELEELYNNMKM